VLFFAAYVVNSKNGSHGICKNTTANSSPRFFDFLLTTIQIDANYGLCDVNARRLKVPAGSRRQKSSTFMSVPNTLFQVSDTTLAAFM